MTRRIIAALLAAAIGVAGALVLTLWETDGALPPNLESLT